MKILRCIFLLAPFAAFLFSASVRAQEPPKTKIKLLTLLGRPLQLTAAEKLGLFSKFGVEVETENSPKSEELRAKLATGNGDLAYLAVDNAVAMVQAGKDYEIKAFGATPQRLVAMREHKEFAGSMLGPPTSIVAKREGFVSLGSVQEAIGPYQAAGFFTERQWAKEHRDALLPFLAAIIEAQRWLTAPSNKNEVIALLTKESHLAPEIAAETYESTMTKPGGFAKDAAFDVQGFQNVLKLRAEVEGSWGGHPPAPEKYYDSSYYEAALAKLKSRP